LAFFTFFSLPTIVLFFRRDDLFQSFCSQAVGSFLAFYTTGFLPLWLNFCAGLRFRWGSNSLFFFSFVLSDYSLFFSNEGAVYGTRFIDSVTTLPQRSEPWPLDSSIPFIRRTLLLLFAPFLPPEKRIQFHLILFQCGQGPPRLTQCGFLGIPRLIFRD